MIQGFFTKSAPQSSFNSFMSLKLHSAVAVVTGKTTASLAKDARFGKPATKKALLPKKVVTIRSMLGEKNPTKDPFCFCLVRINIWL